MGIRSGNQTSFVRAASPTPMGAGPLESLFFESPLPQPTCQSVLGLNLVLAFFSRHHFCGESQLSSESPLNGSDFPSPMPVFVGAVMQEIPGGVAVGFVIFVGFLNFVGVFLGFLFVSLLFCCFNLDSGFSFFGGRVLVQFVVFGLCPQKAWFFLQGLSQFVHWLRRVGTPPPTSGRFGTRPRPNLIVSPFSSL